MGIMQVCLPLPLSLSHFAELFLSSMIRLARKIIGARGSQTARAEMKMLYRIPYMYVYVCWVSNEDTVYVRA